MELVPNSPEDPSHDRDITPLLREWDYESGTMNVRKVRGSDGRVKLQMRLELGLLQMEMSGRPDGTRPFGFESLLDYFESKLIEHRAKKGSPDGFGLNGKQCHQLREESAMYYQRYLSLYVLGDYDGVIRDTGRNLRVLDLCSKFAIDEQDRLMLEQYRPYILMMNARAQASLLIKEEKLNEALAAVKAGLARIKDFFERFGHADAYEGCDEARVLKKFAKEIRKKIPVSPGERLARKLKKAIAAEDYESAAKFRDEIAALEREEQPK